MKKLFIICLLVLLTKISYADEYRIVKDKDNNIVHIHSITGSGNYEYSLQDDLRRFGYNGSYTILAVTELDDEAKQYKENKIKEDEANQKMKKLDEEFKRNKILEKLGITKEEAELILK